MRPSFARPTRFTLAIQPAAPFRGVVEVELNALKSRLLDELLNAPMNPLLEAALRGATNEAAALAWSTAFPLLVFPELLREKAERASRYAKRQAAVLKGGGTRAGQAA